MRLVFVRESDLDHMGGAMTSPIFTDAVQPMTEEQYFALGETAERIELFDGSLFVSPAPTPRHQDISTRLLQILGKAVEGSGLIVFHDINLRLRPDRIPIPDLVITTEVDLDELFVDASAAVLVCEITSPSNAATDKVTKMHYYATAGIPWYLLVDQSTGELQLHQLAEGTYFLHSRVKPGAVLRLVEPIVADIDADALLRRH
jgi:Uma2 family endonuclease